MQRQIEVKILEIDVDEIIGKLTDMGAEIEFDGILISIYFDDKSKRFSKGGDTLRLRQAHEIKTMAFKENVSKEHAKVKDLLEVKIAEVDVMQNILQALGFTVLDRSEKRRTEFYNNNFYYNIDSYADIPSYLELEGPDLPSIRSAARELGFSPDQLKPWSIKDLFAHYKKL